MSKQPATQALRDHLAKTGTEVAKWTPEQRTQHSQLSDAAMREQNAKPQS